MTRLIPPGGGEVLGETPERRVDIITELDPLHMTWSRFAGGQEGAGLHVHHDHGDVFYVLEGELTIRLGVEDEQVALGAGSFACVPPLVVHGFRNASGADEKHLNLHAPGTGFADYMRGLARGERVPFDQHEPPADGGRPPTEASFGDAVSTAGLTIAEREGAPEPSVRVWRGLYVLAGELTAEHLTAGPGAWLELPPDTTVTGSARYLDVRT